MKPPLRVYVVEDEALIAMELIDRIQRMGYDICGSATRGEQALLEVPELAPDVVLMDIRLAGEIDGIDTAARLRQGSDVPVVFLTAHSDGAHMARASQVRPSGYLLKPFQERELNAALMAVAAAR